MKTTSGFACGECGHKFKTLKAAEKASFGPNGCPKCGGSDIDLASSAPCEQCGRTEMCWHKEVARAEKKS